MRHVVESHRRWTLVDFVVLAAAWGLLGGLLEGAVRLWLQSSGATNFDMRLTAISTTLLWAAPLSYAALFTTVALACWLGQRFVGRVDWVQAEMTVVGGLAWLGPIAASGRIATLSEVLLAAGLGVAGSRLLPADPRLRGSIARRALAGLGVAVTVVAVGAAAAAGLAERRAVAALPQPAPNAPNVLVVILDTLRADRLSSYGYPRPTSPALSRVAGQGVQFDWALAASSWSLPAHVSMLTGRYPSDHGAEIDRYDGRSRMVSEAFRDLGYRTGVISANSLVFSRAQGFGAGFLEFDDSFYSPVDGFTRTVLGRQIHKAVAAAVGWRYHPVKRPAEAVTRSARRWIDQKGDRPFFLVLNYFDLHDPGWPIPAWEGDPYDGAVAYVDRWLGELVAYLAAEGLTDNTVLAITSDHGESLGQHGLAGHGTSLDIEQIHVPLILRFPPAIPPGVRVSTPVSHTSLPATLLELASGGSSATGLPGRSLVQLWEDPVGASPWPLPGAELRYRPWTKQLEGQDALKSVLDFPWHFIRHSNRPSELFNLALDPGETNNLAEHADYSDVVRRLQSHLKSTDPPER